MQMQYFSIHTSFKSKVLSYDRQFWIFTLAVIKRLMFALANFGLRPIYNVGNVIRF